MVFKSTTLVAVGAHPDDIELGAGGTISVASEVGKRVVAVFLTKGEKSGNPELRMNESRKALEILGVKDIYFGDFPDTEIPNSHAAVKFLEDIYEEHKPDTVLTHTTHDSHQDHRQTSWLCLSAFRNASKLLSYETPRVISNFSPTYFIDISGHVNRKWNALKCHESQKQKRYLAYESMVNLASFRGSQVGLTAAEAFEVIRYVEKIPTI